MAWAWSQNSQVKVFQIELLLIPCIPRPSKKNQGEVMQKFQYMFSSSNKMEGGVLKKIQISFPIFTSTHQRIDVSKQMFKSRLARREKSVIDAVVERWPMCHNISRQNPVRANVKSLTADTIMLKQKQSMLNSCKTLQ